MRALLDVHAFLWWNTNDPRLSSLARQIIGNSDNSLYLSAAGAWEMAIKYQIGKLPLPEPANTYIVSRVQQNGFQILPITLDVLQTLHLPFHHRDPFILK